MKFFRSLCAMVLLSTTALFANLPYKMSGLFANRTQERTTGPRSNPAKKDCNLATIERGTWAITPKFAVAPTWYTNRGDTLLIGQAVPLGLDKKFKLEQFDDMFDLPLMYGGHVGYMFRKHIEFFIDLDYAHASGRTIHFHFDDNRFKQKLQPYKAFGAYIGTRLYAAFFNERLTPFVGVKVGCLHRWKVNAHEAIDTMAGKFKRSPTFFLSDNTIAGSAGIGFDAYFTHWMGFSFETECLISGQRRSATLFSPSPAPIIRVGDTGPMIAVPFSFALEFKI